MSRPSIFICYRRADSGWAGRLEGELAKRFGVDAVFRDRTIPAGVNWRTHIEGVLDDCAAMVVMIGPSWAQATGTDGVNRLWQADDVVRQEIERALQRADVQVIPVLFDDAKMPESDQLPPGLQRLRDLQAVELEDSRWAYDAKCVGDRLATVVPERRQRSQPFTSAVPASAGLLIVAAAAIATLFAQPLSKQISAGRPRPSIETQFSSGWIETTLKRVAAIMGERAVLWAIVAAFAFGAAYFLVSRMRSGAPAGLAIGLSTGAIAGAVGGLVYVALKDVAGVPSEFLLNGASMAAVGGVLGARFARLSGDDDRGAYRTVGLGGGLVAGVLGRLAYEGSSPDLLVFAMQSGLVIGALAALLVAPALTHPARAPSAAEI